MRDGIRTIGLRDDRVLHYKQWADREGYPSADYIVVDEAQDFNAEQISAFRRSARKALLLYGDSAQQLYNFKVPPPLSMEQIMAQTGFPNEQLVFNHRLPKKIARFAQYLSETDDELELRCRNEGTELPKILKYPSLDAQLDAIAQIIKARNFQDVGVLLPLNEQVEHAFKYLIKKGVNAERKSREGMDLNFTSDNVKIITYHSAKGLQFEAVFIPNCNVNEADKRVSLYVAITRTYQSLYIMHSGDLSTFFDIIPSNLYETSLAVQAGVRL